MNRLPVAPLADEDHDIFKRLWVVAGDGRWFIDLCHREGTGCFEYDRRDADIFFVQSKLPGYAVIPVGDVTFVIAGRTVREAMRTFRRAHPDQYSPELLAWCEAQDLLPP